MKWKFRFPVHVGQLAIRCLIVLGLWLIFVPNFLDPLSDRGLGPALVQLRPYTDWMEMDASPPEAPVQLASLDSLSSAELGSIPMGGLGPVASSDSLVGVDLVADLNLAIDPKPLTDMVFLSDPEGPTRLESPGTVDLSGKMPTTVEPPAPLETPSAGELESSAALVAGVDLEPSAEPVLEFDQEFLASGAEPALEVETTAFSPSDLLKAWNPLTESDSEVATEPASDVTPISDLFSLAALDPRSALDPSARRPSSTSSEGRDSVDLALIDSQWDAPAPQEELFPEPTLSDERFDCIIEPSEQIQIGSAETGVLEKVHFERSEKVKKGEVVAELESDVEKMSVRVAKKRASMDANRRSAEASFDLGKRREERASELYEGNALSLDLREEIETETELAHLKLEEAMDLKRLNDMELARAEAALQRRVIRSPISGVVVDRHKSPGEVVKEESILTIAQVDPLRVEVILPAHLYGSLEPGMKGRVIPEAPIQGSYEASIEIVDRVIDGASGTFGVRLDLPNPDLTIPSGLHCQVAFLEGN